MLKDGFALSFYPIESLSTKGADNDHNGRLLPNSSSHAWGKR